VSHAPVCEQTNVTVGADAPEPPLRRPSLLLAASLCALIAAGPVVAAPQSAKDPGDPYEQVNRRSFDFQMKIGKYVVGPLLVVYRALTPGPIGKAVHNILNNLAEPVVIANDILQGRPKRVAHDTLRLVANTTAGWLGIMDVAAKAGLPYVANDFGITLGRWGVGPGPYLFLPLVGPSTVRDIIGSGADFFLNPTTFISYPSRATVAVSMIVVGGLDTFSQSEGELKTLTEDAADPYATLRSVYLQNRQSLVTDNEGAPELPPLEDEPSAPDSSASPAPTEPPSPPDQSAPAQSAPPPAATGPGPQSMIDPNAPIATGRDWRYDKTAQTGLALTAGTPAA
jgi:phospholipid-binding lipoprotein MlaA